MVKSTPKQWRHRKWYEIIHYAWPGVRVTRIKGNYPGCHRRELQCFVIQSWKGAGTGMWPCQLQDAFAGLQPHAPCDH